MRAEWLWDRKISVQEAKRILKDPDHRRFMLLAGLLLSRNAEPKEVFTYIDPLVFCKNWHVIKKTMRQDRWAEPRIIFWQAIYEKVLEKYRKRGVIFRTYNNHVKDELCKSVGEKIRSLREEQHLSQKELAGKLHVSQQLVSRIEQGKENISLVTLQRISQALAVTVDIRFM